MLLLVTILLVLVAAITLLIGIFSDELALIFISIGASALAAIVLAVLSQMSRKKGRAVATDAAAPEPVAARQDAPAGRQGVAEQAAASIEEIGEPVVAPVEAPASAAAGAGAPLPIENYDSLRVNEILPLLANLDLDELEAVAQHEESRKNRTTILNRIDQRMDELEAAEDATAAIPATTVSDELAEEAVASIEEIGEPVVAIDDAAETGADVAAGDDGFPIPDYDSLTEAELIPLLADLDADQLEAVADREEAGPNRDAVLDAIDDRLDILEGIVPAPAASAQPDALPTEAAAPATRTPAKKAAKKAAAKKAPARKAAAVAVTKKAAPATKKATAAKATKKTLEPATKAPAAKRTAKAAAGATKKAGAPAAKKAGAKKATAAKKATKR